MLKYVECFVSFYVVQKEQIIILLVSSLTFFYGALLYYSVGFKELETQRKEVFSSLLNCIIVLGIGSVVQLRMGNPIISFFIWIVLSVIVFKAMLNLNFKCSKLFVFFRHTSATIYFIHMYIWTGISWWLYREYSKTGIVSFLFTSLISFVAASLWYWIKTQEKSK